VSAARASRYTSIMSVPSPRTILVTGGAGYVGSKLVPALLDGGHRVVVFDLFLYGDVLPAHPALTQVRGDIRDRAALLEAARGCDTCIHLACISNDPSFDLDPALGRAINYDAFAHVVDAVKAEGMERFLVASSTSQYGVKPADVDVTEDVEATPITDYARYKLQCERYLREHAPAGLTYTFVRPATLCGYAPRLRLDLSVNILTIHALVNKRITVFGGDQMRPALHIDDMVAFYLLLLEAPAEAIAGEAFNVAGPNLSIRAIAELVKEALDDDDVSIVTTPTNDPRSYRVNAGKAKRVLGFSPQHSLASAVLSLREAFAAGQLDDPLDNPLYFNIKRMQQLELQ
jgi:nucleoside-diphosphate-sugar epimerase